MRLPTRRWVWLTFGLHPAGHRDEAWLKKGLMAGGLKPDGLAQVKGSDPRKALLADLLWRRTVVSQEWLAENLAMKSAANVSQQIRRLNKKVAMKKVPEELKQFLKEADTTDP